MGNEQIANTLLKAQLEQKQRLLEKYSKRVEQLQVDVALANESTEKEKYRNADLEQRLHKSEQAFTTMLEKQFVELTLVQELARLKDENAILKNQYDYILEHSTDQQMVLEDTLGKLKGELKIVQLEKKQVEKISNEQQIQLADYKEMLIEIQNQSASDKQEFQSRLQQVNEQVELLKQEKQTLLEQLESTNQEVLDNEVVTRIFNGYTKPSIAEQRGILLADLLSELNERPFHTVELTSLR